MIEGGCMKKNRKKDIFSIFCDIFLTFFIYCIIGWLYEVIWIYILDGTLTNRGFLFGPYLPIYGFGMLLLIMLLKKIMKKKITFDKLASIPTLLITFLFIFIVTIVYSVPTIYKITTFLNCFIFPLGMYLFISLLFIMILRIKIPIKTQKKINLTPLVVFILIFVITTIIEFTAHYLLDTHFGILLWDYSKDYLNFNRRICFDASRNFAIGGTLLLYLVQPRIETLLNKMSIKKKTFYTLLFGTVMLVDFILKLIK